MRESYLHWNFSGIGKFSEKHRDVSRTIATAKMELFVGLVSTFQPLTNFRVLNAPLDYYSEICAGDQIKHYRTVACNFSKDNLFHRLVNYSNSFSDCICISYPISQRTPWFQILIPHTC